MEGWHRFVATCYCCCFCCCWLVVSAVVALVDCFPLGTIPLALKVAITADSTIANMAIMASVSTAYCCFVALLQVTAAVFVATACFCYFVATS